MGESCAHEQLVCASCGRVVEMPRGEHGRPAGKEKPPADPLVGKFFHTWQDGKISMQGVVDKVVPVEPRRYMVTTFSWLTGADSQSKVVTLDEMSGWTFYASSKEMQDYYQHSYPGRHAP